MPEGPSIVILREEAAHFAGHIVLRAEGNARIDMQRLPGQRVNAIRSFGKQTLIALPGFAIRIHLLMYGSYRIDERKDTEARLSLGFDNGELNFYSCSVRLLEGELDQLYDWRSDVMSDQWDPALARKRLHQMPDTLVCDALLDQDIFAGVGNIMRCSTASACTRCPPLARFPRASWANWSGRRAYMRSNFSNGNAPSCCASTGWCTTAAAARAMTSRSPAPIWARPTAAASTASVARSSTAIEAARRLVAGMLTGHAPSATVMPASSFDGHQAVLLRRCPGHPPPRNHACSTPCS